MNEQKDTTSIAERIAKEKENVLDELRKVPIVEHACKKAGIGRATFYRWRNEDQEFFESVEQALKHGIETVNDLGESVLISKMKQGNMQALIYWLRHNKEKYKDKYSFQEKFHLEVVRKHQQRSELISTLIENYDMAELIQLMKREEASLLKELGRPYERWRDEKGPPPKLPKHHPTEQQNNNNDTSEKN